jgi:hypothetical protein
VLGACRHEHLLPVLGFAADGERAGEAVCLVTPLMLGGNLEDRLAGIVCQCVCVCVSVCVFVSVCCVCCVCCVCVCVYAHLYYIYTHYIYIYIYIHI